VLKQFNLNNIATKSVDSDFKGIGGNRDQTGINRLFDNSSWRFYQ